MIPTVGRRDALRDTLESLIRCDPLPGEVIVVDGPQRAAEPVVKHMSARVPALRVHYTAGRRGASVQRNVGLHLCEGEVVVFADDDVDFHPDVFGVLADAYSDPDVVGATGRVLQEWRARGNERSRVRRLLTHGQPQGTMTDFGYPRRIQDVDSEHDVEFMQGCLMSARRELAERVGFDENLVRLEDEDFSYRLSRLGRVRYSPGAVVRHMNLGFKSRDPRYFSWLVVVNRAYLRRKNFTCTLATRAKFALLIGVLLAHRTLNREWGGVRGVMEGAIDAYREGRIAARGPRARRPAWPRRPASLWRGVTPATAQLPSVPAARADHRPSRDARAGVAPPR